MSSKCASLLVQLRYYTEGPGKAEGIQEGDVLVSNNPQLAGGSHLPDITVITPVFNQGKIVFFVASRGHHQVQLWLPAASCHLAPSVSIAATCWRLSLL